ncbi:MAG: Ig-like domain-containing protein [Chitinophagales bacterium]
MKRQKTIVTLANTVSLYFLLLIVSITTSLQAQTNLVPNPSFEDTLSCPSGLGFLSNTALEWEEVGIPNHFHTCVEDGGGADVPDNVFGVQNPFSGVAYAGFTAYTTGTPSQRDYITIQLSEALQPDTEYCVEFYVSLADLSYFAVENIGAYFSENAVPNNNGLPLGFVPQVENREGVLKNKNEWQRISGTFTAQSPLQWLTIGNFYNNANTNAENLAVGGETGFTELGYYYIDSISVVALETVSVVMQDMNILAQPETAVLCEGDVQTLTATGAESYEWFSLNDPFTVLSDADTLAFATMTTQSFILQTTDFNCVREYIFTIEVRPMPQVEIGFEATCEGYNLQFTELGTGIVEAATYQWDFYQNGNIVATDSTRGGAEVFNILIDSVILIVNNLENCSASDTLLVDLQQNCQPCMDGFRNLAANPSIEYYHDCPNDLGEIGGASQWKAPTNGSTDYLHTCANTVPSNLYGNQMPSDGEGYLGFFGYAANDYREYASVPILQPLEVGKNYCVRFDVSLADSSGKAISNLGAHLSANPIAVNTQAPLFGFPPQIANNSGNTIADKNNWTTISGIYKATNATNWLTIGNFKDNSNSEVLDLDSTFLFDNSAYYYLDNVSVIEMPALAVLNGNGQPFTTPTVCVGEKIPVQAVGNYCNFKWINANKPNEILSSQANASLKSTQKGLQKFVVLADFGGCILTDTISIDFEPFPQVSFDLTPNCAGAVSILVDTSTGVEEGALYNWNFGDGNGIQGLTNVTNLYEQPGTYTVQLTITNPTGCTASAAQILIIEDICDPCNAENNFVSNSSFEEGICPDFTGQIDRAAFWISPELEDRASLFDDCNPDNIVGVPENRFGTQEPRTDISYAGIKAYSITPSEQQFITNQLGSNLEIGSTYCVSMFVSLADTSDFAISSLGFYFTVVNPTGTNLVNVTPQVVNRIDRIIADTLNWVEISGTFTVDQNYRFLTIGNFKNVLNTQEVQSIGDFNPTGFAYYYIDDVSVVPMEISTVEDMEICKGETVTLTGSSNTCEMYWVNANKPLNVIAAGDELTVSPSSNSTYIFVGQNGNCRVTDSVNVVVKPLPQIDTISVNPNICKGGNTQLLVELSAAGDYVIQWSPSGLLVNSNTPNPITLTDTTTTFYVNITDTATSCSITDSVKLKVNPLPIATIDVDSLFICAGDSMRVSASGGDVFAWEPAEAVSDATIADPYVYSPNTTLNLSVTVSNSQTSCSSTESLIVAAGKTYIQDTTNIVICEGDDFFVNDIILGTLGAPFDAVAYRWEPSLNLSSDSTRNTIISTPFDLIYTLFFTDKNGCEGNVSIEVDVNQVPNAGPDVSICEGGSVQLNVSTGAVAYQWLPLEGLNNNTIRNPIASPSITTTYVVIATYINQTGQCTTNDEITVFVNERGPSGVSDDETICRGDSIQINAFGGNIFEWFPTETLSDSTIATPTAFPDETTTYTVRIFNASTQCESIEDVTITVKDEAQPTILSPDARIVCAQPLTPVQICLDLDYDGCEALNFNVLTQLSSNIVQLDGNCFTYESAFAVARTDTIEIQVCTENSLQCDTTTAILIHCDNAPKWPVDFIQRNTCSEGLYKVQLPQPTDADGAEDSLTISISTPPTNGTVTLDGFVLNYVSNVGFSGTENIVVTVCDQLYPFNDCANLTVRLNVTPNSAPVAVDLNMIIPYETQDIICIEVQDADNDPITITVLESPANGTLEAATLNCAFYTPNDNFYGQDTMVFVACDACNACDTAVVTITVPAPFDPPIVADTTVTTNYDAPISVCLNIEEPNGESFDLSLLSAPINGNIEIQNDSCLFYTPTSEFAYVENIDIAVCDVLNNCTNITLTINVLEPINLPPTVDDVTASTISNSAVTFCFDPDDPENDELEATIITTPLNGDALIVSDTCVIYVSNPNFFGVDSLQVQFCDPKGNCVTAWGVISVSPSQDLPPVVSDTTVTIFSMTSTIVCLDIEELNGDDYSIAFVGILDSPNVLDKNCFEYTSPPGFFGEIDFSAEVCDENNNCTTITVTYIVVPAGNIAPNVTPIAPIRLNLSETSEVCIEATDVNGDDLTYQLAAINPNLGAVNVNDNCVTFFAPNVGSGTVSVTVNVCDDQNPQLCTPIVIQFQINTAPNVVPEQTNVEVAQGATATTCLTITEPEGDVTTINVIGGANNGTASISGNCVIYSPTGNFVGSDNVVLQICDILGACTTVTINYVVTDVLSANNDSFNVEDNNQLTANFIQNDVFTNINNLTINIVSPPSNGSVVVNANKTFTYTPNTNFVGNESFVYEICLPIVGCEQATVSIEVENLLEAINDFASVVQTSPPPSLDISILGNDAFPNVDALDVSIVDGVSNGALILNQTTYVVTYFPNVNFIGRDTFEYSIFYPERGLDKAIVVIEVTKALIPPTAANDNSETFEGESVVVSVLSNDTGDGLFLSRIVNLPINGNAVINTNGTITYTPNAGFLGIESFTYEVCNADDLCVTATVTIEVKQRDVVVVCEIKVYAAMTPNGDGKNERFAIAGLDCDGNDQNELVVFNRWGDEVFRAENYGPNNFWDGRYEGAGESVPDGTYFYVLTIVGKDVVQKGFLEVQK